LTGELSVISASPTPQHWVVAESLALAPAGAGLARLYVGGDPVGFLVTTPDEGGGPTLAVASEHAVGEALCGTRCAPAARARGRRVMVVRAAGEPGGGVQSLRGRGQGAGSGGGAPAPDASAGDHRRRFRPRAARAARRLPARGRPDPSPRTNRSLPGRAAPAEA